MRGILSCSGFGHAAFDWGRRISNGRFGRWSDGKKKETQSRDWSGSEKPLRQDEGMSTELGLSLEEIARVKRCSPFSTGVSGLTIRTHRRAEEHGSSG